MRSPARVESCVHIYCVMSNTDKSNLTTALLSLLCGLCPFCTAWFSAQGRRSTYGRRSYYAPQAGSFMEYSICS